MCACVCVCVCVCACAQKLKEGSSHSTRIHIHPVALSLTVSHVFLLYTLQNSCTHRDTHTHTHTTQSLRGRISQYLTRLSCTGRKKEWKSSLRDIKIGHKDLEKFFFFFFCFFLTGGYKFLQTSWAKQSKRGSFSFFFSSYLVLDFWTWTGRDRSKRFVWSVNSLCSVINCLMSPLFFFLFFFPIISTSPVRLSLATLTDRSAGSYFCDF